MVSTISMMPQDFSCERTVHLGAGLNSVLTEPTFKDLGDSLDDLNARLLARHGGGSLSRMTTRSYGCASEVGSSRNTSPCQNPLPQSLQVEPVTVSVPVPSRRGQQPRLAPKPAQQAAPNVEPALCFNDLDGEMVEAAASISSALSELEHRWAAWSRDGQMVPMQRPVAPLFPMASQFGGQCYANRGGSSGATTPRSRGLSPWTRQQETYPILPRGRGLDQIERRDAFARSPSPQFPAKRAYRPQSPTPQTPPHRQYSVSHRQIVMRPVRGGADTWALRSVWLAWSSQARNTRLARLATLGSGALVAAAAQLVLAAWRHYVDAATRGKAVGEARLLTAALAGSIAQRALRAWWAAVFSSADTEREEIAMCPPVVEEKVAKRPPIVHEQRLIDLPTIPYAIGKWNKPSLRTVFAAFRFQTAEAFALDANPRNLQLTPLSECESSLLVGGANNGLRRLIVHLLGLWQQEAIASQACKEGRQCFQAAAALRRARLLLLRRAAFCIWQTYVKKPKDKNNSLRTTRAKLQALKGSILRGWAVAVATSPRVARRRAAIAWLRFQGGGRSRVNAETRQMLSLRVAFGAWKGAAGNYCVLGEYPGARPAAIPPTSAIDKWLIARRGRGADVKPNAAALLRAWLSAAHYERQARTQDLQRGRLEKFQTIRSRAVIQLVGDGEDIKGQTINNRDPLPASPRNRRTMGRLMASASVSSMRSLSPPLR